MIFSAPTVLLAVFLIGYLLFLAYAKFINTEFLTKVKPVTETMSLVAALFIAISTQIISYQQTVEQRELEAEARQGKTASLLKGLLSEVMTISVIAQATYRDAVLERDTATTRVLGATTRRFFAILANDTSLLSDGEIFTITFDEGRLDGALHYLAVEQERVQPDYPVLAERAKTVALLSCRYSVKLRQIADMTNEGDCDAMFKS